MPERKKLVWLIVALDVAVIVVIVGLVIKNRKSQQATSNTQQVTRNTPEPTKVLLPTRTAEEIKIISQMETKTIEIKTGAFVPANATAKVHDQIQWRNNDTSECQIQGEGWGSPLALKPGRVFTQSFDKAGVYRYFCKLQPEIKGSITIK